MVGQRGFYSRARQSSRGCSGGAVPANIGLVGVLRMRGPEPCLPCTVAGTHHFPSSFTFALGLPLDFVTPSSDATPRPGSKLPTVPQHLLQWRRRWCAAGGAWPSPALPCPAAGAALGVPYHCSFASPLAGNSVHWPVPSSTSLKSMHYCSATRPGYLTVRTPSGEDPHSGLLPPLDSPWHTPKLVCQNSR